MSGLILDTGTALKESFPRVPRIPEMCGLCERIALLRKLGASAHYATGPQPDIYATGLQYFTTSRPLDAQTLYQIILHGAPANQLAPDPQRLAAILRIPENVQFLRWIYEKMDFLLLDQERTLDMVFRISQQAFETVERHKQWLEQFRTSGKREYIHNPSALVGRGIFCFVFEAHLGLRPIDSLFCCYSLGSSDMEIHCLITRLSYTQPDSPFERLYHSLTLFMPEIIHASYYGIA